MAAHRNRRASETFGIRSAAIALLMFGPSAVAPAASVEQSQRLRQGIQLYERGEYAEALAVYQTLLEAEPKNVTFLYEAGLTAKALGDLKACIAYATEAVATRQRQEMSFALLGSCQDDAGDAQAALGSFERGLVVAPSDSQLNYNYALTLARLGKIEESRKHAGISIESDPTRASAYFLYAAILDALKLDGAASLIRLRFITLESHTPRASQAASKIADRAAEYRKQSQDKQLFVDGVRGNPKPEVPLIVLNLAFGLAVATEHKYVPADATDAARFVNAMESLLTVTAEMHQTTPELEFVWQHAAAPLQSLSSDELLKTFLYHVADLAKLDGSEEWLEAHPEERERLQHVLSASRGLRVTAPKP